MICSNSIKAEGCRIYEGIKHHQHPNIRTSELKKRSSTYNRCRMLIGRGCDQSGGRLGMSRRGSFHRVQPTLRQASVELDWGDGLLPDGGSRGPATARWRVGKQGRRVRHRRHRDRRHRLRNHHIVLHLFRDRGTEIKAQARGEEKRSDLSVSSPV